MFERFEYLKDVELKNFSTIKIGGKVDYIVFPNGFLELLEVLKIIKRNNLSFFILGNGSNILFSDNGFNGVALSLKNFNKVFRDGDCVWCGAGINVFLLNEKLANFRLGGVEWSYGIPATLGGIVVNNAGCFGYEIGSFVEEVLLVCEDKLKRIKKEDMSFSYRMAKVKGVDLKNCIIVAVKLKLFKEQSDKIKENMQQFYNMKKKMQPCDKLSLGSIFKRVQKDEVVFPAKLIDNLGLKGVKIGGAEVSTKHAGFIVNSGDASAQDVLDLIEMIEHRLAEVGVFVEKEIEIRG